MWRNTISASFLLLGGLLLTGCAGYTPRIGADETPTGKEAYLYGRFFIDVPKHALALDGHQSMGFSIDCQDGANYVIRFSRDVPMQVVKVAPSTCSLTQFVYTNSDGMVRSRKPAPKGLMEGVTFGPGTAYYLGDFFAKGSQEVSGNTIHMRWRVTDVKDSYQHTTSQMKEVFVKLAGLPTENRMIGAKSGK
jgi:hypothetical protein